MNINSSLIDFISAHALDDINSLRLKYSGKNTKEIENFNLEFALTQIEARKKTRKKLPEFISNPLFMFPSLVASEQASNEAVARFHASLIEPGSSLFDMTAGLGIDDMTFAKSGINVTACEIDVDKCDMLCHNLGILGIRENILIINDNSIDFLLRCNDTYDVIFADPARRDSGGKRIHALSDCMPDILGYLQLIMNHTGRLLVKSSPLLDLSLIINTVENLNHIYVVCFRGECKEVLIDINKTGVFNGISCVDLDWNSMISEFHVKNPAIDSISLQNGSQHNEKEDSNALLRYASCPHVKDYRYLYEPNAAVMKTGAWISLASEFPDLRKVGTSTHLFVSDTFYAQFPGRKLEIMSSPDKKTLKALKGSKINVVTRNYPLSASQIASKYGIIPGSDKFLYAFRYGKDPTIIIACEIL